MLLRYALVFASRRVLGAMAGVVAFDAGCLPEAGAFVFVSHMLFIDKNKT